MTSDPDAPSVGAFVLTWNRPAPLRRTLESLLRQTRPPDAIFVVDNGDSDAALRVAQEVGNGAITCRNTGGNLGEAGGVAFGMKWLAGLGFDWILVVDDDDPPWRDDILERLYLLIRRHGDDPKFGAVARGGHRWDWRRGRPVEIAADELRGDVTIDVTGTGMQLIVRREVIETVGTYHEDLFVHHVDETFCLRMVRSGWRLLAEGELMTQTRAAKAARGLSQPGFVRPHLRFLPAWRTYYSTRNYIAEMRRTFGRPDLARREVARAAARSAFAWLGGPRYGAETTRLQVRAVLDGYRGRLGRTIEPVPKDRDLGHD
jgi:glycosyltransferase involved in cell wall biosynthesis